MRKFTSVLILALLTLLFAGSVQGQTVLNTETFETDGEGTRYTSYTFVDCGNSDFFLRTNTNPVSPATCGILYTSILTNLQGSFFWASEDVIGNGGTCLGCRSAARLTFLPINTTGYSSLTVSLYLATSGNNFTRWESADSLNLQVSFNGGSTFSTVGRFMGKGTPSVGARLGIDSNLDGAITGADPTTNCDTVAFRKYTFNIPQTGNSMILRLDYDQAGGSEELAFDQIEVAGISTPCVPPTITCPGTQSINLNGTCQVTIPDYTSLGTPVGGTCGPMTVVQASPTIGSTSTGAGALTVTLYAQNTALQGSTNTCSFTLNKVDATLPSITCPANISQNVAPGTCAANVSYTAPVGTDNCSGATTTRTGGLASGSSFPRGINPVTFRVTDASGNTATCSFNVTVVDNILPTITCPVSQTLPLDGACQALLPSYTSLATGVNDNCTPAPTVSQSPIAGSTQSGVGTMSVTLTATDVAGNTATCAFTVNKTAPEIDVTGNSNPIGDGSTIPTLLNHTDFGSVAVSGNIVRTFTITNQGGANLSIGAGAITVTGANQSMFVVGGITLPATIAASGSLTFTVTFTPTSAGLKTATINIANNDCNENPYDFAIQGTGLSDPGAALNFDGSNDFVSVPFNSQLTNLGAGGFTLEAWVNPTNVTPTISIIRKTGDYNLYILNGKLNAEVWPISGNPSYTRYAGTATITTNTWTHVAMVWSGGSATLYVNGVVDPNTPTVSSSAGLENVFLGISSIFGQPFPGSMDEVRIWNRPLCQNEIQFQRTCEIATTGVGLVVNYHFNQGFSTANNAGITTVTDASGNSLHGTATNFTLNGATSNWIAPGGVTSGSTCGAFSLSEINVKGNSVTIFDGDAAPSTTDHTDFGSVSACSGTITRTFTIENQGNTGLSITGVTLGGANQADFTVTAAPASSIAALGSTTFQVTFDPSASGLRTATITIANADCNEGTYDFAIQGIGNADIVNPSITCPANISLNATVGFCTATATYTAPVGTDNCPSPSTTQTAGLASGSSFPLGVTTNTFRVTDGSGNTTTCSFTVTVTDNQVPVLGNQACNSSLASGTAYNDGWQNGDNDGSGFGAWTLNASTGNPAQAGFFVATSTGNGAATDSNTDGDINTAGRALGLYANSAQGAQATRPILGTFASGSKLTVSLDNGFVDPGQIIGFQLQNSSGNSLGEVRFRGGQPTYEIVDQLGITPFLGVPFTDEGIIVEVTATVSGQANIKLTRKVNGANQTLPITFFPAGGNQVVSRFMVFNSNAGVGATNDLFVNSMTACIVSLGCPSNISTTNGVGTCGATVTYNTVVAADNCAPSLPVTQIAGLASGATFPVGTTTNTFRATDGSANTGTCSFTVTVADNQLPAITCPGNISGTSDLNLCSRVTSFTSPVGNDNCPSVVTVQTGGLASGSAYPVGTTTNVFRVTDAAGNTATCSFTVTVTDGQAPSLTCPGNIATNIDPGFCSKVVTFTSPVGSDNCSGPVTIQTGGLASGSTYPLGVTTNVFRVTDGAGNTTTCSFTVTVSDNQAPSINCPANITGNNDPGLCSKVVTYTAPTGTDNCPGSSTTQTGGLASGAAFPVGVTTNVFRATDAAGNSTTCSFTVTITDNQLPTITCPSNITGTNDPGQCTKAVTFTTPVGADNCPGQATILTSGLASGSPFPVGTTTNVFRVTDAAGNTATCSFTVAITDNQLPAITCPATITGNNDPGQCSKLVTFTAPVGTDNCPGQGTVLLPGGFVSGSTFPVGTTTNTYRVTDAAGNTATCSFDVVITDNELPTITCPANTSASASVGVCSKVVTFTAPIGADNCPGQTTVLLPGGLGSGASFPVGTTTNTYRVTDASGNTATCSFTVVITDNQLPSITCPANASVSASVGACSATFTYTAPVGSDNCAGATTTQTAGLASGAAFPVGSTTNTFRVTDASGNTATCSFTVVVSDNQAPAITCPANASVSAGVGACSATFTYTAPVGSDNCAGASTTQTAGLASGAAFPAGTTTNTFRVTDAAGNSTTCSFTVVVTDNQLPTITCPANASVSASVGACSATFTYTAPVGSDNCAGATTTQTAGLASGSAFPVGTTTNTYRVTDASGNTATCTFTVVITDNQLPTITCPANASVSASVGACSATFTYTVPVGSDNCAGATTTQTAGLASGSAFPVGTTTNTYSVTDAAGNTATCSFTVVISDNQLPTITCPANISVSASVGACSATVNFTAPVGSDNCPGQTTVFLPGGLASGSAFPVGTTTNTYRVTDAAGNSASCSFNVVITDNQLPVITCPGNITGNNDPGQCSKVVTFTAPVGTDNCAGQTTTLQPGGLPSGSAFPVGTTTNVYLVTDASGNSATCSFTVVISDVQLPTVTCPANISVNASPTVCGAAVSYTTPVGADNCPGSATTMVVGQASGTTFPVGVTPNTYLVTDASGNSASCSFTVTVTDVTPPNAVCQNISIYLDALGAASTTAGAVDNGSTDICGIQSTVLSQTSFGCAEAGSNSEVLTVTDIHGNLSTCGTTVTVLDTIDPMITCPNPQVLPADSSLCGAIATWTFPSAADNCAIDTVFSTDSSGTVFPTGVNTVTYVAMDVNGNSSVCNFVITVNALPLHVSLTSPLQGCGYHLACALDSNANVSTYVSGGCLPYSYLWSSGDSTENLTGVPAGLYHLTVTDAQGSTHIDSIVITAPAPLGLMISGDTVVCDGFSTGVLSASASGGQDCASYSYLWSNGGTANAITGLPAGTYTVTATDSMGCMIVDTAILRLGINPVLDLGPDTTTCPGGQVLYEAPPIYTAYQWNIGSNNSVITMTAPGPHILTVWTADGCTDTDTLNFIWYAVDHDIITPQGSLTICDGDTVFLDGDPGLQTYTWSTGATTPSLVVTGFGGPITLNATDANGCPTADTVTVNNVIFSDPHPVITPGPTAQFCDGGSVWLTVFQGYSSYLWSNGSTADSILVTSPGTYDVTVANGFGCTDVSSPATVVSVPNPNPSVVYNAPFLSTTSSYVDYQWLLGGVNIPGAILPVYEPIVGGWYSVYVVDSNGCSGTGDAVYVNPVGVGEVVEVLNGLVLYPNPSLGNVSLRTEHPIDWPVEIEIWDMYGKKLRRFDMAHLMDVMAFDLQDLPAAPYLMRVSTFKGKEVRQATIRFVIE